MVRAAGRRPGGRSARVRAAVLEATLAALVDGGPLHLRIEDVAARAGVAKTTIYRHWPTKEALVADAVLVASGAAVPVPDLGTVRGDLLALAAGVRAAVTSPASRAIAASLAAAGQQQQVELAEVRRRWWARRVELTSVIVTRAVERGELPAGVDAARLIEGVAAPIWFRLHASGGPVADADLTRLVDDGLAAAVAAGSM